MLPHSNTSRANRRTLGATISSTTVPILLANSPQNQNGAPRRNEPGRKRNESERPTGRKRLYRLISLLHADEKIAAASGVLAAGGVSEAEKVMRLIDAEAPAPPETPESAPR